MHFIVLKCRMEYGEDMCCLNHNSVQHSKLVENNRLLAAIIHSSQDAIIAKTIDGTILSWNPAAEKIYGYNEKEIIGKNISIIVPEEKQYDIFKILEKISNGEKIQSYETIRRKKNGDIITVSLTISPIENDDGEIIGASTIARDITKEKEVERETNLLIHALGERVKELDCLYNVSKLLDDYNCSLDDIFKKTVEMIPNSWQYPDLICSRIVFDGKEFKTKNFSKTPWQQSSDIIIADLKRGFIQVCYLEKTPDVWEGPFLREERHLIDSVSRQIALIAERKRKEEHVKSTLSEKESLLKEIHHRVKNNLQMISAMIKLQSETINDEISLEKLKEMCNRIQSIALIHDQLYNTINLSKITVQCYMEKLALDIMNTYRAETRNINVICNCKEITLDVSRAIPCALIVNELLVNACKHAFTDTRSGTINIDMIQKENKTVTWSVKDNGKGLPEGFDIKKHSSLGLQLVNNLVKQLKGSINHYNDTGAVFVIKFANK